MSSAINKNNINFSLDAAICWLREENPKKLEELWNIADEVRRRNIGDKVHLRGLVEFSNICKRRCGYCGISALNTAITRYRMSYEEIMECVRKAVKFGYGTVVLQSGEDPAITTDWITDLIRKIRAETELAITLSVGERDARELEIWRKEGADRYLLRFETSNKSLFDKIHPPDSEKRVDRIEMLRKLRKLDYEVGSGVMVGIPGQTYEDLARDIELFRELDLDMIGIGPYIPHPHTPLGANCGESTTVKDQAPNSELMTYKMLALSRIACPLANIPSTTALATLNKDTGRELGLMRGANIIMPNLTPTKYREAYEIYPDKACINETAEKCFGCLNLRIVGIDREMGKDRGDSPNWSARRNKNSVETD